MFFQFRKFQKSIILCGISCFSFVFCSSLKAAENPLEVSLSTQKYTLDNGLTVLVSAMPSTSAVSVYGLVKTGSALEGKFLGTGISHFMEHMLFKGTDKRGVGQISREVQAMGGEINASTSFDYTIFTITVPREKFDQALDILADMLMHSKFAPEQIEKEREVVYGEMRLYKDRPENRLSEMVYKTVYTQHPYRIPIIGYEELLRDLHNEDFVEYYRARYIPDNIIISIAGNVEPKDTLDKVKNVFKDFKRQRLVLRNLSPEPAQISPRRYEEDYHTDLTRVSLAYQGVSLLHNDMIAMDVLAMALGQGESSRLYREIFKKQRLVQDISASNFTPMDRGVFEIEFIPAPDQNVDHVIVAIKEQIKFVQEKGIDPAELEKIKTQVISSHIYDQQTSGDVAYETAMNEATAGDYDFAQKYVQAIGRITSDDVRRVANAYFKDDNLSVLVLNTNQKKEDVAKQAAAKNDQPIEKFVLDNGLTILLKENPTLPIVSVNLVLNGGVNQEPINGLSELTARSLVNGTKSKSAEQIAESVESHGASLSGFSGRNSFGVQMGFLSKDLNWAFDLLEDVVKNPAFDEAEFAKEKEKVRTSILTREDSISSVTFRALRETLFQTHPFRREPLGTLESVESIKAADAKDFYEKLASSKNMVLSIFGNINKQEVLAIFKKKFAGLKSKETLLKTFKESSPEKIREKSLSLEKQQAMVAVGFQGADFYSPDRYGLEVMSSILGSSFSGRIFNRIRDEFGQAYTLGGSYTPGRDLGLISFYVLTTKESVAKVEELLKNIIQELAQKPVDDQELVEIKTYLKGSFAMGIETNSELSFISALDELYGLGYNNYQSYPMKIDQITKEDIQRLARTYLDLNKAAVVVAQPKLADQP